MTQSRDVCLAAPRLLPNMATAASVPRADSSAQHIIWIHREPDTCPYHQRYHGNIQTHKTKRMQMTRISVAGGSGGA